MSLALGTWVTYTHILYKSKGDNRRIWRELPLPMPQRALYIGRRTLANGHVEWSEDEGVIFHRDTQGSVPAALLVVSTTTRPIRVPFACIEPEAPE